jgi:hypothetical protein
MFEHLEYRDGQLICVSSKRADHLGKVVGTFDKKIGYVRVRGRDRKSYLAHRIIFEKVHGWCPKYIDHINGNTTDNRVENLRPATYPQNNQNSALRRDNTSGCRGVTRNGNAWMVCVSKDGEKVFSRQFHDKELAELVATEARRLWHGNFARV